jgi:DNA repair exonuclease SbcCD ATPase subunit
MSTPQTEVVQKKDEWDLVQIADTETIAEIFTEPVVNKVIGVLEEKVKEYEPDTSTAKGRKEIASLAFKVSRSKTAVDKFGKDLVAEWKEKSKKVDLGRKLLRDSLDDLRDRIRKPLTDWEQEEERKKEAERIEKEEAERKAQEEREAEIREQERKNAEERERLEKQRRDQEERELEIQRQEQQRKREEEIKKEAEEKAKREAETRVDAERREQERKIAEEKEARERAEDEKKKAEIRHQRELDEERRHHEERERKAEEERKQQEAEKRAEDKRRAEDVAHRNNVRSHITAALMLNISKIDADTAIEICDAIDSKIIPHVTINY